MSDYQIFFRWFPSRFLKFSAVVHILLLVFLILSPDRWLLITGILLANHIAIFGASLWPQSKFLGPNVNRLSPEQETEGQVALTFDDGPDPDITPKVLSILEKYSVNATFFCVGRKVENHPDLVRKMVRMGHQIENHSYFHANTFAFWGPRAMGKEIDRAQKILSDATGSPPAFFRPPAGIRNPYLEPVLSSRGLCLASWSRRGYDSVCRDSKKILRRITRKLSAGDVILLHDGSSTLDIDGQPVILKVLPKLLKHLKSIGLKPIPIPRSLNFQPLVGDKLGLSSNHTVFKKIK